MSRFHPLLRFFYRLQKQADQHLRIFYIDPPAITA
jgi:hypothetical protein